LRTLLKILKQREISMTRRNQESEYCLDSLLADIENLRLFSGIHPLYFEFHRMLASRFPFGIYYREHGDETQVFAILDLRRNPNWIRKELKKRND